MWSFVFGGDEPDPDKEDGSGDQEAEPEVRRPALMFGEDEPDPYQEARTRALTGDQKANGVGPGGRPRALESAEQRMAEERLFGERTVAKSRPEDERWLGTTIEFQQWHPPEPEGAESAEGAEGTFRSIDEGLSVDGGFHECDEVTPADSLFSAAVPSGTGKALDTFWDRGDASRVNVRTGPDYLSKGSKEASALAMYRCVSVDAVRSEGRAVTEVLGQQPLPPREKGCDWRPTDQIPRVVSVIMVLPYRFDMLNWGASQDFGCSLVSVHVVEPETLQASRGSPEEMSPALRLFLKWAAAKDVVLGDKGTSGALKMIALCENFAKVSEDYRVMSSLKGWNGTPALVTKSGRLRCDPSGAGEWIEIIVDVRMWALAVRMAIYNLRAAIPRGVVQCCVLVQGVEDDELPERILCSARAWGFDMEETPVVLEPHREFESADDDDMAG